jgi:hypothetical protein
VDWSHVNSPHHHAPTLARNLRPNPQELGETPGRAASGSGRPTLAAAQNADGGWGYFPGKQSWLEPTVYALLALSDQSGGPAFARGWRLIRSWERRGGGWRGCAVANQAHWATSLVVTLHAAIGAYDAAFERGVAWLTASIGVEGRLLSRVANWLQPNIVEFDPALTGWPWQAGASSWIEPTAHALMALRSAAHASSSQLNNPHLSHPEAAHRIATGERMLLERRCRDGGWNYGNRRVLGADLPSYPETTAMALMALNGHAGVRWEAALNHVERMWRETRSPLARAWLGACLLQYRGERPEPAVACPRAGDDLVVAAVDAIRWDRILA